MRVIQRAEHIVRRIGARYPGMRKALESGCSLVNVIVEHGQEKVGELCGVARTPLVLFGEHLVQLPRPQLIDVTQLTALAKELARVLAHHGHVVGYGPEQLDDVRDVVLVA